MRAVEVLARRVTEVEAVDAHAEALAAERDAVGAPSSARVLDLGRAEDALVAGASAWQIVDVARITSITTTRRRGCRLVGSEGDMNVHVGTLAVHAGHATLLSPSGARDPRLVLGVRPADLRGLHELRARSGSGARITRTSARSSPSPPRTIQSMRRTTRSVAAPATMALIAINVVVYMITAAQGGGINLPGGKLFSDWALAGPRGLGR